MGGMEGKGQEEGGGVVIKCSEREERGGGRKIKDLRVQISHTHTHTHTHTPSRGEHHRGTWIAW